MKSIYILLACLLPLALGLKAQNFQFLYEGNVIEDTLKLDISSLEMRTDFIHFKNISEQDYTIEVYLQKLTIPEDAFFAMCFGENCLLDTISNQNITINAGEEYSEFDLQYIPNDNTDAIAKINILNDENNETLQSLVVLYTDITLSIKDNVKKNETLSLSAYPNPAKNTTTIEYSIPSKYKNSEIIIRDMVGKTIKTIPIEQNNKGKKNISLSEFANGVYFYSISNNGIIYSTKKLIIRK
ncbi:MAG: T9SS type A sorting domain-containing protein [Bacteroidales bacterium]|jgi:hypothetical protein|nr:T9SS type A sorting domain-containing protein [Bacteroidales bacterium]